MKEIKLAFRNHPKNDIELMHLAEVLAEKEQQILIDINAVLDREEIFRCKRFVEEFVTLEINDYERPRSRHPVDFHHLMNRAKEIVEKYRHYFDNPDIDPVLVDTLHALTKVDGDELHHRYIERLGIGLIDGDNLPRDLYEELEQFINEFGFMDYDRVGHYNHLTRTITIYADYFYDRYRYNIEKVVSVFAHEIFHAYHAHLIDINRRHRGRARSEFFSRNYKDVILKESLASFFESYYDERWGADAAAQDVRDSWRYPRFVYPYAGARLIKDDQHFKRIVDDSVISFDLGYRTLIEDLI